MHSDDIECNKANKLQQVLATTSSANATNQESSNKMLHQRMQQSKETPTSCCSSDAFNTKCTTTHEDKPNQHPNTR
jgi:hypothetical protein